jgi:predicted RNase H-like nuclease (RuvC/YqgF family)
VINGKPFQGVENKPTSEEKKARLDIKEEYQISPLSHSSSRNTSSDIKTVYLETTPPRKRSGTPQGFHKTPSSRSPSAPSKFTEREQRISIEQEEILRLHKLLKNKDKEIELLKNNMRDAEQMIDALNTEIQRMKKIKQEEAYQLQLKFNELYNIVQNLS